MNAKGKAGEFGGLKGGYMFRCSIRLARDLLKKNCVVLKALGKSLAFEVAVGMNGRVFVKAEAPETVVLIVQALKNSENLEGPATVAMVDTLVKQRRR